VRSCAVLLFLSPLLPADIAILTDGDRITGTVQKLENGKLFFQSKHSPAPLEIDWSLIASLTTDSELKLTLADGSKHQGRALVSAQGFLPSNVSAMEPLSVENENKPGWIRRARDRSSVSIDFGQSYSGLAQYNQFSSNTEITYTGDRWDGSLITHYYYYGATDSGRSTYQGYGRVMAQRYIRGDHLFLFPYGFLGRQTASGGGSGQVRQYGGGAGWTFRRQYENQVSLFAGMVRSAATGFTVTDDQRVDSHAVDTLFISGISWESKMKNKVTTSMRLYYFKPVNIARYHAMAIDASAKIPLVGPVYFNIRAYDTPELRQKQLFSTKNLQLSSGIGIEF